MVTFRDIHELIVSSVRLLLLRDLIKIITENKDSQAYVDENMESTVPVISNSYEQALYSFINQAETKKKWQHR